ncbi:MAG: hypothetical protein WBN60_12135 [Polyangiales bacterium]
MSKTDSATDVPNAMAREAATLLFLFSFAIAQLLLVETVRRRTQT